uniref:DUF1995 domain-containing protein n=1 Tax=Rhizophora mucronata TaxID=61149 RepID=A0A2P2K2I6_RHIMU
MPSSNTPMASSPVAFAIPSFPVKRGITCQCFHPESDGHFHFDRMTSVRISRGPKSSALSASRSGKVEADVPFPYDYAELLEQAKKATELALENGRQLMEIEFPTAGLQSVPGDGEGGIEMTGSMQLIREFCDRLIGPEKVACTRIFFPEASEVKFARKSAFEGSSLKLDYLTKPSFFEDFGFVEKVKMADRVKPDDELFLVAYPYFNVNEMLVVEELYKEAVANTMRKLIVFNGELDRIRSGCILCSFHWFNLNIELLYQFSFPSHFLTFLSSSSQQSEMWFCSHSLFGSSFNRSKDLCQNPIEIYTIQNFIMKCDNREEVFLMLPTLK